MTEIFFILNSCSKQGENVQNQPFSFLNHWRHKLSTLLCKMWKYPIKYQPCCLFFWLFNFTQTLEAIWRTCWDANVCCFYAKWILGSEANERKIKPHKHQLVIIAVCSWKCSFTQDGKLDWNHLIFRWVIALLKGDALWKNQVLHVSVL